MQFSGNKKLKGKPNLHTLRQELVFGNCPLRIASETCDHTLLVSTVDTKTKNSMSDL